MGKKVMVIDDDESYVYLLRRKVKTLGEDVSFSAYSTGKEAMDYFNAIEKVGEIPDVVILDLNMPVMDGFGFLESFRNLCNKRSIDTPPPILLVATSSDISADRERVAGYKVARDYLVKPIKIERIAQALQER